MCCRYYYEDFEIELRELMKAEQVVELPGFRLADTSRRDISPSQSGVVIHGAERGSGKDGIIGASEMAWGFANPVKKGLIINARAETAREKVTFADSMAKRRCVIPASGFYEWDPYKARYRFTAPEGGLLLLAGFYRKEQGVPRFTILTTEANDSMIKIHDRMPVMIGREEIRPWIEDDAKLPDFLSRKQTSLVCEQDYGQIRMDFGF
ncbi:MAG: SOS response-associated peptidase [Mogibacterium sp.]|nr:SOS response-associated peptidase [Mogibacterium sp.]MBQ6501685.1 SOS response-associated peptidase [Mogibacterium sp.]